MIAPFRKMGEAGIDESVGRYTVVCKGEKERCKEGRGISINIMVELAKT